MSLKTIVSVLVVMLVLVGCPYIDNGATSSPDSIVTLTEISGCYYYEKPEIDGVYHCTELCIDSVSAVFHKMEYRISVPELSDIYTDTIIAWSIQAESPKSDGTMPHQLYFFRDEEPLSLFMYGRYTDDSVRKIIIGNNRYSLDGRYKCEF